MKQYYIKVPVPLLILFFVIFSPIKSRAQCACAAGATPDSIAYSVTLSGLTTYTNFNIPKFDPTTGTLTCIRMRDTINSILSFSVANRINDRFLYNIKADLTATVSTAPSVSSAILASTNYTHTFGPYDLGTADISPDPNVNTPEPDTLVSEGPVTVFSSTAIMKLKTSGFADYMGVGTIPFTFDLSGPVWAAPSSGNYGLDVHTTSDIVVRITYYYCPLSLLASNINNFIISKKGENIQLNWSAVNQENVHEYVVEFSTDGKNFAPESSVEGSKQNAGQYSYSHSINSTGAEYIYFRVKQVDENGKVSYSAVRTASLSSKAAIRISSYPNPATDGFNISFDRLINGNFKVDLVSAAGQVVYSSRSKMNNANVLNVNWIEKPAPGIYFARVTNLADMQQQLVRVIIR